MELDEYRSKGGFTIDDLASSTRTLFFALNGQRQTDEWHTLSNDKKARWSECVGVVVQQCEMEVECAWRSLAGRCYIAYHGDRSNFENEKEVVQLQWESLVRNIVNMVTIEEAGDLSSLGPSPEDYWVDWLIGKMNGEQRGETVNEGDELEIDDGVTGSRYG